MSSSVKSQERSRASMTLYEKLVLLPRLISVVAQCIAFLLVDGFRGKDTKAANFRRNFLYAQVRIFTDTMSIAQTHTVYPPTDKVYASKMKSHKLKAETITLEDGTTAHWIGSSSAKKIVINFHGGGYVLPASKFMVEFMIGLQKLLTTDGKDVAVLFLSYDLAPEGQYPRQLQQAALLFSHVINVLKRDPADIVLTGDSAGGNLVVALLSHLSHPHPSKTHAIKSIKLEKKLAGAVLISPWISMSQDAPSFTHNKNKDLISLKTGQKWAEAFMGTPSPFSNSDYYNNALTAPLSWWDDLKVEELLILAGKDEVLVDGIVEFGTKLRQVPSLKDKVTTLVAVNEAHDMPSLDLQFGYQTPGEQARLIRSWISSRL